MNKDEIPLLIHGDEPKKYDNEYICQVGMLDSGSWLSPYIVYEDCHENAAEKYANHEALSNTVVELRVEDRHTGEARIVKLRRQFSIVESKPVPKRSHP